MATRRADGLIPLHFRYRDAHDISRRKTVYGKTLKEAQKKKADFLADVKAALRIDQAGRTVASWADEWLEVYKKPHVSEKRLQTIGYDIKRIKDAVGSMTIKSVTQADLQRIINARAGRSSDGIRKTAAIIKAVFKAAVDNRLIPVSPADGLIVPAGTTGSHRALEDWEIKLIIRTAPGHRFGVAAMLMLFAGLRRGEVADFHSRDVDMKARTITVRRAVTYVSNQGTVKKPKTEAGSRTIPIMPPLLPFLSALRGYAIAREGNDTLSLQAFRNAFKSFLTACELNLNNHKSRQRPYADKRIDWKTVSFQTHDLRHTFATMLYDAGTDIKTAQLWLGHASPALTMKLYTHLSASKQEQATKEAEKYFAEKFVVGGGKTDGNHNSDKEKT